MITGIAATMCAEHIIAVGASATNNQTFQRDRFHLYAARKCVFRNDGASALWLSSDHSDNLINYRRIEHKRM